MHLQAKLILSAVASAIVSAVIIGLAFYLLQDMKAEVARSRVYDDASVRANALSVLLADIKSDVYPSDIPQFLNVHASLTIAIQEMVSKNLQEEALIRQVRKDSAQLKYLLTRMLSSNADGDFYLKAESKRIFESQVGINIARINDDINHLISINKKRIVESHESVDQLIIFLGLVFIASHGFISYVSIVNIVRAEKSLEDEVVMRRANEVALRESEERFKVALENLTVGNIVIDEHGIVQLYNSAAAEIFGYAAAEVLGRNVSMLMPEPDRRSHDTYLANYLRTGHAKIIGTGRRLTGQRRDGSEFPMHLGIGEMRMGDERLFIGAVTDLTDALALEAQLRQSQKMDAVGQLVGGLAHDLNNMLGVIVGNMELLQEMAEEGSAMRGRIDAALGRAKRGAGLTKKLLGLSRETPSDVERIDANELLLGMENLLAKSLTVSVDLKFNLTHDPWEVEVEPGDFENAVLNLVLNARDAMPNGGQILIETTNRFLAEDYVRLHPAAHVGDHLMVSVSDTGTGMTPEIRERIFEPFFSTKGKEQGTGLGLSMVYGFVNRSGGNINVYSEPGIGTAFHIYLPRARDAGALKDATARDDAAEAPRGTETVLVVDDEPELAEIAETNLQALGYTTLSAPDGKTALEVLAARPEVELLFSDVVMPGGMDGFDLAFAAQELYPQLKVLLTSGFSVKRAWPDNGRAAAFERLSGTLLNKPYSQRELAFAVRRALETGETT